MPCLCRPNTADSRLRRAGIGSMFAEAELLGLEQASEGTSGVVQEFFDRIGG